MKMFVMEEPHVKESTKALNILYVYDRTYEPYLIYWLFPLQLAFQGTAGESECVVKCTYIHVCKGGVLLQQTNSTHVKIMLQDPLIFTVVQ